MAPSSRFDDDYTQNRNQLPTIDEIGEEIMVSKLAAERVVKIVKRCEEAKENNHFGRLTTLYQSYPNI